MLLFRIDWGEGVRIKKAQGTIKTLMNSHFSTDVTSFLTIIRGLSPKLGEGTGPSKNDIKLHWRSGTTLGRVSLL